MLITLSVDTKNFTPISFKKGVNIVLGKKERGEDSYNSVGKTLLLKLVDYLYGAKESSFLFDELKGCKVTGSFVFKSGSLVICRDLLDANANMIITESSIEHLDVGEINVKNWRTFLSIYYWEGNTPNESFRGFSKLFSKFESIENFDNAIKINPHKRDAETGKILSYLLALNATNKICENDVTLKTGEKNVLKKVSRVITKTLSGVDKNDLRSFESIFEKCNKITNRLNDIKLQILKNKKQLKALHSYVKDIEDLLPEGFNQKFEIYEKELGNFLKKNYEEAHNFHTAVLNENKEKILSKITEIESQNAELTNELSKYEQSRSGLYNNLFSSKKVANSDAETYLLSRYASKHDIYDIVKTAEDSMRKNNVCEVRKLLDLEKNKIRLYRRCLLYLYRMSYKNNNTSNFSLEFDVEYTEQNIFKILFNIPKDKGEGIGSLKSLLFLFLLCCINAKIRKMDYFLLDSASIDSIDRDVLSNFLKIADWFARVLGIQLICAVNIQNIDMIKLKNIYIARELTPSSPLFCKNLTQSIEKSNNNINNNND